MKRQSFLFTLLFLFSIYCAESQQPPCWPDNWESYYGLTYRINLLDAFPVNKDMPENVIESYMYFDSLSRNVKNLKEWNDFLARQTYLNDTLRYYLKYIAIQNNYDGLTSSLYWIYRDSNYQLAPIYIYGYTSTKMRELLDSPYKLINLANSINISHIKVNEVKTIPSPTTVFSYLIITGTIIDTISGKVIPICKDPNLIDSSYDVYDPYPRTQKALPGSCFQFSCVYTKDKGPPVDSSGNPWIVSNREYIMLTGYAGICSDDSTNYYWFSPFSNGNRYLNMYPVIDGKVFDPDNVMGYGTVVDVDDFKQNLKSDLNSIYNYSGVTEVFDYYASNAFLLITPNPAYEELTVTLKLSEQSHARFHIYDIIGNEIFSTPMQYFSSGYNRVSIQLKNINSGCFYLSMETVNGITTKGFFKL